MAIIGVNGDQVRCDGCERIFSDWYERNDKHYCWSCTFPCFGSGGHHHAQAQAQCGSWCARSIRRTDLARWYKSAYHQSLQTAIASSAQ